MIRNYLKRMSMRYWTIHFYTIGIKKTIQPISINIQSFDKNTMMCSTGEILFPNEIVIQDNFFDVVIFFPLSMVFKVTFHGSEPFTRKNILHSIKILYDYIYKEEERTATVQEFKLKKICSSCHLTKLDDFLKENSDKTIECSICYDSTLNDKFVSLDCNHTFHENCIQTWSRTSATCPICRYNIFMCMKCNGSGIIYYGFTGISVPSTHRNHDLRNQSNGIFGIHSYDFNELFIDEMIYNNVDKKLYLNVTGKTI